MLLAQQIKKNGLVKYHITSHYRNRKKLLVHTCNQFIDRSLIQVIFEPYSIM